MRMGFTYRNKHCSELGITMATKSRPVLPERRTAMTELPTADGEINYAVANEYGRAFYKNRVFTLVLCVYAANITELENRVSRAAVWLSGEGELIFDDMPGVIWDAAVLDSIDYLPERSGTRAVLSVSFTVQPFSRGVVTVGMPVLLGSEVLLGSDILLGGDAQRFDLSGSDTIEIENIGTAPVRPIFTITNEDTGANQWSIECNGRTLEMITHTPYSSMVIDLEKYTCTAYGVPGNAGGVNFMGYVEGSFFELAPGKNTVSITCGQKCTLDIAYDPRFIWNTDYYGGDGYA